MPTNDVSAQQIDTCLRRLSDKWSPISYEPNSTDGLVLYQLLRRGLAEARCRFVAWSPESNFELWFEGTITGRWTEANAPAPVKEMFPQGQRVGLYQHFYTAARMSPSPTFALPEEAAGETIQVGRPIALTGELVRRLLPIDRALTFANSYKRVPRVAVFYLRAMFADGTRRPVPSDSIVPAQLVQGLSPSGGATACNVAELEAPEGVQEQFVSSSAISFAFAQASFACAGAMRELLDNGGKGDILETDHDFGRQLGDACARLHHTGKYVIAMYQRHARDPSYIAAMVANPLSVRNVDYGLLQEIDTTAAMDSACGSPPPILPSSYNKIDPSVASVGASPGNASANNVEYDEVLKMIRYMGRAFETTPDTYAKFSEEELRNHILTYVIGHIHGGASAERFRKHGKTDLCVDYSGGAAFVAECKIWEGPSECGQALDQLMSYVTPRDRVGALIFFNKSVKNFTKNVIKVSENVVRANRLYVAQHAMADFGEHCFEVHHKDDEDRPFQLYVLLFNLYPNPREISEKARKA